MDNWIPVTDETRKPQISNRYWVTTEAGNVIEALYGVTGWQWSIAKIVIAWRPIEKPEPYKPPKEFKMGDKVREISAISYRDNIILVTGPGKNNKPGIFSGTVIQHKEYVGFHSDDWDVRDFVKI